MGSPEYLQPVEAHTSDEFDVREFNAPAALQLIDDIITDVYMPFRGQTGYGTERAVLVEPAHIAHRENDAEHSWHIGITAQVLWDNRHALGLEFPKTFDVAKAVQMAVAHDIMEIREPDVDAVTPHAGHLQFKKARERAARQAMSEHSPYLNGVAELWEEYALGESNEARFVNDIDKVAATRMICLDDGRKWLGWNGYTTSRDVMCDRLRGKLVTGVGHALFDALELDLDSHPEYFPEPGNGYTQDTLF